MTLHGRRLPITSVELVQITDLEPYLQGTHRSRRIWAIHHKEDQ